MDAKTARDITDKHVHFNQEYWWMNYKDKLFKAIKENALKGKYKLTIHSEDELNEYNWIKNKESYAFARKKLIELEYDVNGLEIGGIVEHVTVSWSEQEK